MFLLFGDDIVIDSHELVIGCDYFLSVVFKRVVEQCDVFDGGVLYVCSEDVIVMQIQYFELYEIGEGYGNIRKHIWR